MRICVYPGSFDPFTNGHLDLTQRALEVFDRVVVGVLHNSDKRAHFSLEERVAMIERCLREAGIDDRCGVVSFSGLTIEFARQQGAVAILRGLRAVMDFEYEWQLALMNRKMAPDIDTIFFMAENAHAFVSSSVVRELAKYGRDISDFVPAAIAGDVQEAFREK